MIRHFMAFLVLLLILVGLITLSQYTVLDAAGQTPNCGTSTSCLEGDLAGYTSIIWDVEEIYDPRDFFYMRGRNLAYDSQGYPHIAYGGDHLYYARHDEQGWHTVVVDGSQNVGANASLVLDKNNHPHIAYEDNNNGRLKYARWTGNQWDIVTPITTFWVDAWRGIPLAVDNMDRAHFCYGYWTELDSGLGYTYWDGTQWQHSQIADDGKNCSLVIANDGRIHVSYQEGYEKVKYAVREGVNWIVDEVANGLINQSSLDVDNNGNPHLIYFGDHYLKYTTLKAGIWQSQDVGDMDWSNQISLALTGDKVPHVVYTSGDSLIHGTLYEGIWQVSIIASGFGDFPYEPSIAIDANGDPAVSYLDPADYALKLAHPSGESWTTEKADQGGRALGYLSLDLDSEDKPHASYFDHGQRNLIYSHWTGEDWVTQVITRTKGGHSLLLRAEMALDGDNRPHIAFAEKEYGNLFYTYWDGNDWIFETVDNISSYTQKFHLAVGPDNQPQISYCSNSGLKHASRSYGIWSIDTVGGSCGFSMDLALDKDGQPHIINGGYSLNHNWIVDGEWQIELIDNEDTFGGVSLVLNDLGELQVVYELGNWNGLKYAYRSGGQWQTDYLIQGEDTFYPAAAVDDQGRLHIAWLDGNIKYGVLENGTWREQRVSEASWGSFVDIELQQDGLPLLLWADGNVFLAHSIPLYKQAYMPLILRIE